MSFTADSNDLGRCTCGKCRPEKTNSEIKNSISALQDSLTWDVEKYRYLVTDNEHIKNYAAYHVATLETIIRRLENIVDGC